MQFINLPSFNILVSHEITGQKRMRWLDRITDRSLSNLREIGKEREAWHAAAHEVAKSWTQLSD